MDRVNRLKHLLARGLALLLSARCEAIRLSLPACAILAMSPCLPLNRCVCLESGAHYLVALSEFLRRLDDDVSHHGHYLI